MRKLIPFFPIIVLAFITGCSTDSANQTETPSFSGSSGGWRYTIFNKSDHDIVIEYSGGKRTSDCEDNSPFFSHGVYNFRNLDACAARMRKVKRKANRITWTDRIVWSHPVLVVFSTDDGLFAGTKRSFPNLSPCALFNYPFIRDRSTAEPERFFPVANHMRIVFDKGTPLERFITYTDAGLKSRDLRRNEQWIEDPDSLIYRSYTFTNADYDLAGTVQESALEPIPAECLQESNYDPRPQ